MTDVLLVLSTLAETGPVNQVYSTVDNLDPDISVSVLTLSPEPAASRLDDFESLGVQVETLDLGRLWGVLEAPPRLARVVRRRSPDVVHTHGIRPDLLGAFAVRQTPTVATLHTDPKRDYPPEYGMSLGYPMARVHLLAVRGVDTVVACSSTVADDVAGFVSDIRVVRNGVDASKYSPRDNFEGVREELNLGTDVPVFLSIGGLNQRKDPLFLIRGFNEADIEGHLLLVGEGPLREECERLAGESVTVAGFVDSTLPYLQSSDYFVSASGAEGLPLAVVEGMACGLPVVLSDIGPHREILSLDSRAGELFRKHTPEGFADAVRSAVARDYQTMSCAVRNVVKKELNAEVMGREYSAIYREVCQ